MQTIRALIVDDEPLARKRIRALLAGRDDVEVVAEAGSGEAAVKSIREHGPDLVFLDVQMPGLDGFGALEALRPEERPVVIFTTAHDAYALQAFEVHALDYLLKPFDDERFETALERARTQIRRRGVDELGDQLRDLLEAHRGRKLDGAPENAQRLVVKSGGRITFVDFDEIDWIEAEGSYACLHVGERTHMLRETMHSLEARLPAGRFLRIHRSAIVNLRRVREIQGSGTDCRVVLQTGSRLSVSQSYREKLQKALGI